MQCSKCKSDNPDSMRYCGQCGARLMTASVAVEVAGEQGAWYCATHKKTVTRVRCGRCEKPVCPRCMVHSPAGVRCRECARSHVPIRPMGVLHSAGRSLDPANGGVGRTVWYMAVWYFIISIFTGFFGGHDT